MPLESATYIHQLNSANPLGSDPISAGDDHLRLIKSALQATFPNITGPVTSTHTQLSNLFPVGGIIMWSGSIASIPSGWALCDGTNGTPNLRNRFIVGAGDQYAVGATGGADSVTLTESQIPGHTHTITATGTSGAAGGHTHTIADPGHSHTPPAGGNYMYLNGALIVASTVGGNNIGYANTTGTATTGISVNAVGDHTHTISVSATAASTGGGTAHENRPPYYALAYIMKV